MEVKGEERFKIGIYKRVLVLGIRYIVFLVCFSWREFWMSLKMRFLVGFVNKLFMILVKLLSFLGVSFFCIGRGLD